MKEYVVTVQTGADEISLEAENEEDAKDKAFEVILEEYGKAIAFSAIYTVEEV